MVSNVKQLFREIVSIMNKSIKYRFIFSRKGSIMVETAIFLPIFLIGLLTFAYLIKFISIQESIFHSFVDETRVLSAEAGFNPVQVPLYEPMMVDRIHQEHENQVTDVRVDHFLYLYPSHGMTGLISMDLNYDVKIRLPVQIVKSLPVSESLLVRGFIGKEENNSPFTFEEMEKEQKSELVWIFPRSGGKYHAEDCTYIKSEPRQMILNQSIRKKYAPCSICDSSNARNGCLVYCFRTGDSYHSGDCPCVEKFVISIEKEEAVKRGYTPCSKCGGE